MTARGVVALAIVAAVFVRCGGGPDNAELARRTAASRPVWQSYQEDIKGQIGAGPVAQWEGTLQEVRAEAGSIRVVIRLAGPWASREVYIPIMLQEPMGGAHSSAQAVRQDDLVTYTFTLPKNDTGLSPAWIEIKFPREERRIVLSEEGIWKAGG